MKWALVHPEPNKYDFEALDRFVEFGEEIRELLGEIRNGSAETLARYRAEEAKRVKELPLNRAELTSKALPYERLDQFTVDIILGVRQ